MQKKSLQSKTDDQLATRRDVEDIVTKIIDNFAIMVGNGFADTQAQINTLSGEFHEFKAEMSEFKVEMLEFKSDMTEFKEEMTGFKGDTEPVLYSLQSNMFEVKAQLIQVETRLTNVENNVTSLTAAMRSNWHDHEHRITRLEERVA